METKTAQETIETRNTKVVQDLYAAYKANDIQALLNGMSNDIDWIIPGPADISPLLGARRGRDQVADFFKKLEETEEVQLFEPREYVAQGDKVVVLGHYKARVKATSRTMESDFAHIFTIRNGKVTQFRELADTAAALIAHKNLNL